MTKHKFETTEGLLEDVMRKQAGSIEKAVLEAVMNSVDAGADEVHITLEEDKLVIKDNGKGMDSDEIEEYFKKFGLKGEDIKEKEFGKFRMGRGQIFNFGRNIWSTKDNVMVVSLNEDEADITIQDEEHHLDLEGLSYQLLESKKDVHGCTIKVQLYDEIEDIDDKVEDIKKLIKYIPWQHDLHLTINGEEFYNELNITYETETAYINISEASWQNRTKIYNKGAYVKSENIIDTRSVVVTKEDLDLNFPRNDIISGCPVYARVRDELKEVYVSHLKYKDELSTDEADWLIEHSEENPEVLKEFTDKPMISTATGEKLSLDEISGSHVFRNEGSREMAEDIHRRTGAVPIDSDHSALFDNDNLFGEKKSYSEIIESDMKFEMDPYSESNLGKRAKQNLVQLRWAAHKLTILADIELGVSKHRNVWMTDSNTLYVDKSFLKAKKTKFATHVLPEVLRHSQFRCDTRSEVKPSGTFYKRSHEVMEKMDSVQLKIIEGHKEVDSWVEARMD